MFLYLDVCCLNRPFDDSSQTRVRIESEAVLSILDLVESGQAKLVCSDIIDDELSQMPNEERREKIQLLLSVASKSVSLNSKVERRAMEIQKWNISPLDALHLASAEAAQADYFLTTDDNLLRRALRHSTELNVKVENPAQWIIKL